MQEIVIFSPQSRETWLLGYWPRLITLDPSRFLKFGIFRKMSQFPVNDPIYGKLSKIALRPRNLATRLLPTPDNPRATTIPEIWYISENVTICRKWPHLRQIVIKSSQRRETRLLGYWPRLITPEQHYPTIIYLTMKLEYIQHCFRPVWTSIADHTQNFPVACHIRSNRFSPDYMRAYACRAYLLSGIWAATSRSLVAGVRRVFKSMV